MTKNGFEFFSGAATEGATLPQITVRKNGLLVLTQAAVEMLDDEAQHVRLAARGESRSLSSAFPLPC